MNIWMLGRCIGNSAREPLTSLETQVTCVYILYVFAELFLWGTCFHALRVAHGGSRHCCDIRKHCATSSIYAFAAHLSRFGAGLAHIERVLVLPACHIVSTALSVLLSLCCRCSCSCSTTAHANSLHDPCLDTTECSSRRVIVLR